MKTQEKQNDLKKKPNTKSDELVNEELEQISGGVDKLVVPNRHNLRKPLSEGTLIL